MTTHTRLLTVLTAGILTLGLAACGGDDDQATAEESMTVSASESGAAVEGITDDMRDGGFTVGADDVEGTIPVVTVPFPTSTPRGGANTFTITCPFGGRADIATPAAGDRVVRPDTAYDYQEIPTDRPLDIPAPVGETSVIQISPDMDECQVSITAGPAASMGDYTVTEPTVFAISVPRD